jgi:uncharacterized membrane protein YkvA (DUF1232 family)
MIRRVVQAWNEKARGLRAEAAALYLAYRDPRVPWYAKLYAACVLAYLFSPIDLIPDFIPVLGYLDELVLMPMFIAVARKLIPAPVLIECRAQAHSAMPHAGPKIWVGTVIIVTAWIVFAGLGMLLIRNVVFR